MTRKIIDLQSIGANRTQIGAMIQTIQAQDEQTIWTDRLRASEKPGAKDMREA